MKKLYLYCDGVILDTINPVYEEIIANGKELNEENVINYYQNIDWYEFILRVGDINNAIEKIKKIIASGEYDVKILTHVHSEKESKGKIKYFREVLPEIEIITVPKSIKKADFVDAKDAILVDDYTPNLDYWYEKGGIPIKFSSKNKRSKYSKITDLEELFTKREELEKVKS